MPKQVIMIATSIQVATVTVLCESIRYQAKSEQNVLQDLIPRVRHGEAALCTLSPCVSVLACWSRPGGISSCRIYLKGGRQLEVIIS